MQLFFYLMIGLCAGVLAGLFGVGGGLVITPALVLIAGYPQATASGTSLVALLAPVGLGGVYAFYQAGKINATHIKVGLLISAGMFFGSFLGSRLALGMSDLMLKRAFCIFILAVAVRIWLTTL